MNKKHYIIPIFVPHEGCPHDCVFCNQNSITGTSQTANTEVVNADTVKSTIDSYLETIDKTNSVIEVSFFGGTFTAIRMSKQKELLEVAKRYKDMGSIEFIRLSTRPDYIDVKILSHLKYFGVDIIELGVQSLDDEVLIKSGRGHTVQDVIAASELIQNYGFTLGHQIMLGLPGDSFEKDIETTRKIISLSPEICRIYPALVIKQTPMETLYHKNLYKPYSLNEAVHISKIVFGMLVANGIKVIRIGLQPTEEINEGKEIVTGPFHPAFRELVEGSLINDMILECTLGHKLDSLDIIINSRDISKLYANKKEFFYDTKKQLKTTIINIIQDNNVDKDTLILKSGSFCKTLSVNEFLIKKYKEGNLSIL